jgi:hypothetical protein
MKLPKMPRLPKNPKVKFRRRKLAVVTMHVADFASQFSLFSTSGNRSAIIARFILFNP